MEWTCSSHFARGVPWLGADPVSFFGAGSRRGLICSLLWMYKHQKAFCFKELDSLSRGLCTLLAAQPPDPLYMLGLMSTPHFRPGDDPEYCRY